MDNIPSLDQILNEYIMLIRKYCEEPFVPDYVDTEITLLYSILESNNALPGEYSEKGV